MLEFFKPTWRKIIIALVLTLWPYVASFLFVMNAANGDSFSDPMLQLSFWSHSWYWSPLYFIVQHVHNAPSNHFWQSNVFYFYLYPILRLFIRYILACTLVYFANKFHQKHSQKRHGIK